MTLLHFCTHHFESFPKEDSSFNWATIIAALIAALTVIIGYIIQKQKESNERIIESKRNAYNEFLKDFTETAINIAYDKDIGGIKDDRRRINARNLLLLYGNDKVVKAYNIWVDYNDRKDAKLGSDEDVALFGKILIEIRKDLHGESKLSENDISNLNPFNRG